MVDHLFTLQNGGEHGQCLLSFYAFGNAKEKD